MMTAFKSLSLLVVGLAVGALPHLSTAACSDEAGKLCASMTGKCANPAAQDVFGGYASWKAGTKVSDYCLKTCNQCTECASLGAAMTFGLKAASQVAASCFNAAGNFTSPCTTAGAECMKTLKHLNGTAGGGCMSQLNYALPSFRNYLSIAAKCTPGASCAGSLKSGAAAASPQWTAVQTKCKVTSLQTSVMALPATLKSMQSMSGSTGSSGSRVSSGFGRVTSGKAYKIKGSGSSSATYCTPITSMAECQLAATSLGFSDRTASSDGQTSGSSLDPPYCYYESNSLKYNSGGKNRGGCSSSDKCLCKCLPGASCVNTGTTTTSSRSTYTGSRSSTTCRVKVNGRCVSTGSTGSYRSSGGSIYIGGRRSLQTNSVSPFPCDPVGKSACTAALDAMITSCKAPTTNAFIMGENMAYNATLYAIKGNLAAVCTAADGQAGAMKQATAQIAALKANPSKAVNAMSKLAALNNSANVAAVTGAAKTVMGAVQTANASAQAAAQKAAKDGAVAATDQFVAIGQTLATASVAAVKQLQPALGSASAVVSNTVTSTVPAGSAAVNALLNVATVASNTIATSGDASVNSAAATATATVKGYTSGAASVGKIMDSTMIGGMSLQNFTTCQYTLTTLSCADPCTSTKKCPSVACPPGTVDTPNKKQVAYLKLHPACGKVSASIAYANAAGNATAVKAFQATYQQVNASLATKAPEDFTAMAQSAITSANTTIQADPVAKAQFAVLSTNVDAAKDCALVNANANNASYKAANPAKVAACDDVKAQAQTMATTAATAAQARAAVVRSAIVEAAKPTPAPTVAPEEGGAGAIIAIVIILLLLGVGVAVAVVMMNKKKQVGFGGEDALYQKENAHNHSDK